MLSDIDLIVTRMYDMQLRPGWPMAGMGEIPEMGWVIVGADGRIRLQRVDLFFGDHAQDLIDTLREAR